MNKTLKSFLLVFPIFLIIIFITTWGLLNGYFEQDEWLGIASVMNSHTLPWWSIYVPWVHFSPLGIFFWSTLYNIFHLQAQYYFLIELIVHSSIATLVFILTAHLTKNKTIAALTGLLFLLNGRAHQAFTHLSIVHSTDAAMFFILLFFVYLSSIKEKILSLKKIIILFLIFLAAVLVREEGFIIVPLFVAYLTCFDRFKINKTNFKYFGLLTAGIIIFLFVRVFVQTLNTEPVPVQYQITGSGAEYNLATIPVKFVVQNLIWSERIALFFLNNTKKAYPDIESYFTSQAPIIDAAFFYIFSLIVLIFAFWFWYIKPKRLFPILIFFSVWVLSNAFMLSFVGRHISVVEPRYLYFSSFPVFCLFSIFIYSLYISKSRIKIFNYAKKISVIMLLAVLFLASFQEIRIAVDKMSVSGIAKKKIIKSLHEVHPVLSKNTIFYVKCKVECYRNGEFGISTKNVLPFSSGPGMNFLVTYAVGQEKEWGPFFTNEFLFHTFSEGYKKIGDRSFGYFVAKSKLEDTLKKNHLSKNIVVALEINEDNYTFKDISKEFRETIFQN